MVEKERGMESVKGSVRYREMVRKRVGERMTER